MPCYVDSNGSLSPFWPKKKKGRSGLEVGEVEWLGEEEGGKLLGCKINKFIFFKKQKQNGDRSKAP